MTMEETFVAFEASPEVAKDIHESANSQQVRCSAPTPVSSAADPLDAPIGGEEIKLILEIVTVALGAGKSVVEFVRSLRQILEKHPEEVVTIRDPRSGKELGKVNKSTSEQEIEGMLRQ